MSIKTELERITQAKSDLKEEMQNRGLTVGENTVDKYAEILATYPYVMKGTFTPQEDTKTFSVATPFTPAVILLSSDALLEAISTNNYVDSAIAFVFDPKGKRGAGLRMSSTGATMLSIAPTSASVTWEDTGFTFELPDSVSYGFKSGYTYDYYIAGGFSE